MIAFHYDEYYIFLLFMCDISSFVFLDVLYQSSASCAFYDHCRSTDNKKRHTLGTHLFQAMNLLSTIFVHFSSLDILSDDFNDLKSIRDISVSLFTLSDTNTHRRPYHNYKNLILPKERNGSRNWSRFWVWILLMECGPRVNRSAFLVYYHGWSMVVLLVLSVLFVFSHWIWSKLECKINQKWSDKSRSIKICKWKTF